jgi:hypothetical protein
MKTLRKLSGEMDSARVGVLLGLSIGLGIAVHEGFFLLAGAIAIGALATTAVHAIRVHHDQNHLAYRAR